MKNKIFIIIPVHNRLNYTQKCLVSIKNQDYKKLKTIVIDDGSSDNTFEFIDKNYPQVQIIKGSGNLWWTKSMAIAVESVLKQAKAGDFVLSLNNDCYFDKSYISSLVNTSNCNKRSIVGSLVLDSSEKNKVIESGIKIDWNKSIIYGLNDLISDRKDYYTDKLTINKLDTLPGKGTLIPIEVFKKIGNFNYKRLPHYIGDYEFFCRAKRNGYNLIISTKATLFNFAKTTGSTHLEGSYSSYKKVLSAMFSKKSKINILDYLNFILLCCPRKYLAKNIKIVSSRFLYFIANLYPFCYLTKLFSFGKLIIHNIPIYLYQNKFTGKFFIKKKLFVCKICHKKSLFKKYINVFDDRHGYKGKFNIFKCRNCGFLQTIPQLDISKLSDIYSEYYPKRDLNIRNIILSSNNIPSKDVIYRNGLATTCHYQTSKKDCVLDIGCGTCQSLLEIKNLGGKAFGIDVDRNSQNVAKKLGLKFNLGTIYDCKFSKHSFDLITGSQVLEHEPNPIKFLQSCGKYLKTGGKIILSFPNTGSLYNKFWGRKWLHWHIPYHLNHFNKKSLLTLTKQAGYSILSLKTCTPNLWTLLQIKSYLNQTKEGKRDSMWDNKPTNKSRSNNQLVLRFLSVLNIFLFINRFIDYIGFGESFVIELRANEKI